MRKNDGREFNSKRVPNPLPQIFIFKTEYRCDRVSSVCMTEWIQESRFFYAAIVFMTSLSLLNNEMYISNKLKVILPACPQERDSDLSCQRTWQKHLLFGNTANIGTLSEFCEVFQ